ncbi:putative membrane protein (TIGR04086 family) [Paenibacillus phyllosphaerae]|uniref:Putative membrane protein (TIGR04086 family) n=1 Tax=Paenibacillus phyllosphaerae TaxID=274593 RepID=A0A7W5AWC3_9BACL|nr:TIGR04086 family membrane protein [Paenibacillus phyllosphaerae]MBB3109928.1 putative membrane protein (TIGR04086 family) [Paenibacillus phyllosphaerae]
MKKVTTVRIPSPMLSGILYASIWLALGAVLLSLLLRFGSMQEEQLSLYSLFVHGFAALAGGFVSGKRSGKRGWYYGGALGLAYGLLILLVGFLASNAGLTADTLTMMGTTLATGALGGIFGVNMHR